MPTSQLEMWPAIINLIYEAKPRSILDVGPGNGKGGLLIREYIGKPDILDAVEAWPGYINPIMAAIYDTIFPADVCALSDDILASYDLVLMIDVIEHIEKSAALDLLSRIPGTIIICTPIEFFDNPPDLPYTERHISHWTIDDFAPRIQGDHSQLGGILVQLKPLEAK